MLHSQYYSIVDHAILVDYNPRNSALALYLTRRLLVLSVPLLPLLSVGLDHPITVPMMALRRLRIGAFALALAFALCIEVASAIFCMYLESAIANLMLSLPSAQ